MRLTALLGESVEVLLYVLADHRMEIAGHGFETEFAGELTLKPLYSSEIPDSEEESLVDLLTQRPYYVTKLRNENLFPPNWTEDIYFERSVSDERYHKVLYETKYRYVLLTDRVTPGLQTRRASATDEGPAEQPETPQDGDGMMLGLGLALLAVLAGVGLAWRRRSRPKPENKEEA